MLQTGVSARKSAGQTALERIQVMKKAMEKQLLNKEISKMRYSEEELGEGQCGPNPKISVPCRAMV